MYVIRMKDMRVKYIDGKNILCECMVNVQKME